jgi:hypothetical protein
MAGDRDWDKELAKIDKQLSSLSDEALLGPSAPVPATKGQAPAAKPGKAAGKAVAPATPRPASDDARPAGRPWGLYARLTLSVAAAVAIAFWPYEVRCGAGLAGYLAAVGMVTIGGIWSTVWTWRHRAGRAHSLSLFIILWGLVLGSMEVLPRIGYGKPDLRHPAEWACK